MSVYLHDIPLPEAQARFVDALKAAGLWGVLGIETIPLDERAVGRVLAEPVWAKISSPHYHASAMDGFAVRSGDTTSAGTSTPVVLQIMAMVTFPSSGSPTMYVDTGDPLPDWADAVIPIELVEPLDHRGEPATDVRQPQAIRIRAAVTPWSHVRPTGEDIVATQLVLPAGQSLRPVDLGAIAACGHGELNVARRPRVAILPTGTELVPPGQPLQTGDIVESNSLVLAAQVNAWGGEAVRFPITPDDFDQIRARVQEAAQECDLILLNAGSSAGAEDFSARVIASLGQVLVHGVAIRPGHPVILGVISNGEWRIAKSEVRNPKSGIPPPKSDIRNPTFEIPIIGVPGYPVSAALTGEIFVEPLLGHWLGRSPAEPVTVRAVLTRKVTSPPGDDDYLRVALGRVGGRLLAAPLARGAGMITSLVRADGIVVIPCGLQGMPAGEEVTVQLYRPMEEIERAIFAIGSHDIALDLLGQYLAGRDRRLTSANVGSQGGLLALQRGEAHLAGSHLLDPESGEYNLPAIRQYLPGVPVRVVALVKRQQGLLVPKGNPKQIGSLNDIVRSDVTFVNRQRGAGTRLLLDYEINLKGIAPSAIRGYNQEEFTHLAVAVAIASGRADCGLGIAAAAMALDLEFVPLFQERYDLVIPLRYAEGELLAPLFELLHDPAFRRAVAALPGYEVSRMGTIIAEVG